MKDENLINLEQLEVNIPKISLNSESFLLGGVIKLIYPDYQETNSISSQSPFLQNQEKEEMRIAELGMLAVHSCMQGKGIGRSLILEGERRGKEQANCQMVIVPVLAPSDVAIQTREQLK